MFPVHAFPATAAAIQDGVSRKLHTGVQIYISRNCAVLLDAGMGEASSGKAMTATTIMPWRSAGKPLTALLLLKVLENGRLSLSTKLSDVLPETSATWMAELSLFHLLTHQSGLPSVETGWPQSDWAQSIARILAQPQQLPIGSPAYHPQSSWFLLGEILRRTDGRIPQLNFEELLWRDLLLPLGMLDSSCGVSAESGVRKVERLPSLYERDKGELVLSEYCENPWLSRPSPGGNLRGPVRELARFYEMMLRGGRLEDGTPFVTSETVHMMTRRHRAAQFDQTLQQVVDFGLGVICNSNRYGSEIVPYGFGKYAHDSTFGHGGSQCSNAFCDPEHSLVVAWSANGFCGEAQHQRRNRLLNEAIYSDLGFVAS